MRRLDQDVIAGGMAEAIVDGLEVVEVDKEDSEVGGAPSIQSVLNALTEEVPVGQSRQWIVEGLEGQLLLEGLALLQIARVQDHPRCIRVAGAAACDRLHGQPCPVGLTDPPLTAYSPARIGHGPGDQGPERVDVLRVSQIRQG